MTNLSFVWMVLEDFKSFNGKHRIDFADFDIGVHFVRGRNQRHKRLGPNGTGKSTLWDALCWCLTGKTPRGLRNPDVRPRGKKVTVRVRIKFASGYVQRTAFPNTLTLNGKDVGQEQIDAFTGLSFEVLNHTLLLGQFRPLFFDIDAGDKMQLLSDVLVLDRWETRSQLAAERARGFEKEHTVELTTQFSLRDQLTRAQEQYTVAKAERDAWEARRTRQMDDAANEIKNLDGIIATCQDQIDRATLALDSAGTEVKQLVIDIEKAERGYALAAEAYYVRTQEVGAIHLRADQMQDECDGLGKGSKCPTCGQPLHNAIARRAELRRQIEELRAERVSTKLTTAKENAQLKLTVLTDAKRDFEAKAEAARDILDLKRPGLAPLNARRRVVQDNVKAGFNEPNPHADRTQDARQEVRRLEAAIEDSSDKVAVLLRRIDRATFWVKGFKDIRLYVVGEVLQELELTTNAMLEDVGLSGWSIKYGIERETKKGTVKQGLNVLVQEPDHDKPVRWESWSGGESQRLRLVGALALAEVLLAHAGVTTNLEILDEPTQHLSAEGVRDVCDYLVERARYLKRQIWYVDHMSVDSARFASVTTVVKDRTGSYIQ